MVLGLSSCKDNDNTKHLTLDPEISVVVTKISLTDSRRGDSKFTSNGKFQRFMVHYTELESGIDGSYITKELTFNIGDTLPINHSKL